MVRLSRRPKLARPQASASPGEGIRHAGLWPRPDPRGTCLTQVPGLRGTVQSEKRRLGGFATYS